MAYRLYYYDVVKSDIAQAKEWYNNQRTGLDKEFARQVKRCINRLQKNPLGYQIKYKNVRTAFTEVFPYAIHFYLDEISNQIVIIAIIYQGQNPLLTYGRAEG